MGGLFGAGTVAALSETQLLERFLSRGDGAAFEAILARHGPMVLGVCRRILDDPHDVDDAFQTTFLILVKNARSIRGRDALGPWLHGVARRVAVRARVNARRRGLRERTGLDPSLFGVANPSGNPVETRESLALLDDELQRLPNRYRTAVVLCDLQGQTHEEAAERLSCPVGTVKSRLARGRDRLRDRLARRGLAPAAFAPHLVPPELMNQTTRAALGTSISPSVASLLKGVLWTMTLAKLRLAAIALLAVGFTVACAWTFAPRARAQAPKETAKPAIPVTWNTPEEPRVERFALANGLKVILRPIEGAESASVIVLFSIGSDHDPSEKPGLAHMLEHLYATAAGDTKGRTAEDGATSHPDNAQTGDRYTMIVSEVPEKDLDTELRDAAARLGNLKITQADLDRERPRIEEELTNMFESFPQLAAQNIARELIRPTPSRGRSGGTFQRPTGATFRAITLEDLQTRWKQYYKPRNAILSIAGAFDPAKIRKPIEALFGAIPPGDPAPKPADPGKPGFGEKLVIKSKSGLQGAKPTVALAYYAPAPDSPLFAPFLVLVSRLWGNMDKLKGEGGAFGVPVYYTPMDDGAVVVISADVKPGEEPPDAPADGFVNAKAGAQSLKAFARIEAFVADTVQPKLTPADLELAQDQLGFVFDFVVVPDSMLGNIYGVAFSLGRREQLALDSAKLGPALKAVTDDDLRRAAKEFFDPKKHAGAFVLIQK